MLTSYRVKAKAHIFIFEHKVGAKMYHKSIDFNLAVPPLRDRYPFYSVFENEKKGKSLVLPTPARIKD